MGYEAEMPAMLRAVLPSILVCLDTSESVHRF
jgi:hypothetical protein